MKEEMIDGSRFELKCIRTLTQRIYNIKEEITALRMKSTRKFEGIRGKKRKKDF